ncbi:MAG: MlaD family protein [Verrucomicrobiota bacterium]
MKGKTQAITDKIIAIVVIGSSAILLGALAVPLMGLELDTQDKITIELPTATGLRPSSEIRYAGAPIGKILEIRPLDWDERTRDDYPVRVIATIDENSPSFKADSIAEISSDTLLAEKFIDIHPGSAQAEPLAEGQPIYSKEVASFDDLTREGMVTLETVNQILVDLKENHPDLPDRAASLIESAENLALNADHLVITIDEILEGNEDELNMALGDLNVVMQNLKVVSTYSKALTATLGRKPWRVIWGTSPNNLPTEEEIIRSNEPIRIAVPTD